MKIQLLLTGHELMAGHTVDSNSAMIAEKLAGVGHSIHRKVTIGDDHELLISEINQLTQSGDVLIINGGLGPTVDDLTAQALATATHQSLCENHQALQHLQQWCEAKRLKLNDANLKQAMLPENAEVIPNPVGSAVGFSLFLNDCLVICTPGVPSELRAMMDGSILTLIQQHFPASQTPHTLRWQTYGIGESTLQQLISNHLADWPDAVEIGFRAGLPLLEIKFTVYDSALLPLREEWSERLKSLIGDNIVSTGDQNLAQTVVKKLTQTNQRITLAESCTGGLIASLITEVAGASQCFEAGFVTYSNAIKQSVLGVQENSLINDGAVSETVVREMALGALQRSQADYAIAVSGIAGPDGGTEDKPVGTVWIAWGTEQSLQTVCLNFNSNRRWFQIMVAATALDLIRRDLEGISDEPRYFKRRKLN